MIGLSEDEKWRRYKPNISEYTVEYPLIDRKMERKDCIQLVKDAGYTVPPKSGCYFCPFQSKGEWSNLNRKNPELYDDAIKLEEMDLNFPTYGLYPRGIPLKKTQGIFFQHDTDHTFPG